MTNLASLSYYDCYVRADDPTKVYRITYKDGPYVNAICILYRRNDIWFPNCYAETQRFHESTPCTKVAHTITVEDAT
jgi:hypothetical protein